jgi:hypothetical protein
MARAPKMLFEEYGKGSQDLRYIAVFEVAPKWEANTPKPAPKRVRVDIRRDAYDKQSWATAEIFSVALDKWEETASIHYSKMASLADNYYDRANGGKLQHHKADVETLLNRVKLVIQ